MGGDIKGKYNLIGPDSSLAEGTVLATPVRLYGTVRVKKGSRIGKYTYIGHQSVLGFRSNVGNYCSIAPGVEIAPSNHPTGYLSTHPFQFSERHFTDVPDYRSHRRVQGLPPVSTTIGNDVWIGVRAVVCQGVTVGSGAIVAAGSVVTKDVPAYAVVGGVPARVIRYRVDKALISPLLESQWWDLEPADLDGVPFHDIKAALPMIAEVRKNFLERNTQALNGLLTNSVSGSVKGIVWFETPFGYADPDALSGYTHIEVIGNAVRGGDLRAGTVAAGSYQIGKRGFDAVKNRYRLQLLRSNVPYAGELIAGALSFRLKRQAS